MKHWNDMTAAERQERLGDASIDRTVQTSDYEAMLVTRYLANLPLSLDGKRRARQIIKGNTK